MNLNGKRAIPWKTPVGQSESLWEKQEIEIDQSCGLLIHEAASLVCIAGKETAFAMA